MGWHLLQSPVPKSRVSLFAAITGIDIRRSPGWQLTYVSMLTSQHLSRCLQLWFQPALAHGMYMTSLTDNRRAFDRQPELTPLVLTSEEHAIHRHAQVDPLMAHDPAHGGSALCVVPSSGRHLIHIACSEKDQKPQAHPPPTQRLKKLGQQPIINSCRAGLTMREKGRDGDTDREREMGDRVGDGEML